MKFRDGYWHLKEGIKFLNYQELRDFSIHKDGLTAYTAAQKVNHRGDTLNGPILTTSVSSPMEDVIHIRSVHQKGALNRAPRFELQADSNNGFFIEEGENSLVFSSGSLKFKLSRDLPWKAEFSRMGKMLTSISGKHSGHVKDADGKVYMSENLTLSVGENIYGLGERFTPFVKNGQVVDIWNEDGGTASEQAYKNIPFYLSSKGYGILVNNPGRVSFEVASEVVTSVQFSVPGEFMDYYIISGDTLKDVLKNYTALSGRPALPPAWSFGLWLTTSFTTDYNEETVNHFVDGMAERDIPLHTFHFDCFWMKEYQWVDFEWDRDQFPEPEKMLQRLKAKGLHICVWINSYIAQKSCLFDEGVEKGYLVKNPDGSVWQWDRWQAGMGLVDFTNPDAVKWFQSKLKKLLDMGVDTFKTDFGERIPTDVVYHDGSDPHKMHNYYTYLYNQTVFDLLKRERGEGEALVFARSATVGGQKFPVHWGGDCSATYESMAESLRGGLSLALSGFGFWSHDIGGFELTATPDLFKRWIAFGSLSSHSRLHGNESYRVPWNFDEESCDVLRFFTKLKSSLMPYLFTEAVNTVNTGIPMMRAMVLEHPDDPACAYLDRQYYLGPDLLVAPVFNSDSRAEYYLPEGYWTNFITNETTIGGRWVSDTFDYFSLPLMVKSGTLLPVGAVDQKPDYDYVDHICFHLFDLAEGESTERTVCLSDGSMGMIVRAERNGNEIKVHQKGSSKAWSILLRGVTKANASLGIGSASDNGYLISLPSGTEVLMLTL